MHIQKQIITQHGVAAPYHKILRIEAYPPKNLVTVLVGMYPSLETLNNPSVPPLWTESFDFILDQANTDIVSKMYTKLLDTDSYSNGSIVQS
jgi:hypothetical protein